MKGLHADLALTRGDLRLDVQLSAAPGSTIGILGPNGSGKSTFLRAVAGLFVIETGSLSVEDVCWADSARGVHVAPARRDVGMVFQDLALFPSMNVRDNVLYGARGRLSRSEAARRARNLLGSFGLSGLDRRAVSDLSGGEAQAVAIARALVPRPGVLLLDEPLSSLDVTKRAALRRLLRAALKDIEGVRILVTHDPLEAGALADEIVILEEGRVVQRGTVDTIAAHPRSKFAASLGGTNLLRGTLQRAGGGQMLQTDTGSLIVSSDLSHGTEVLATIHPHAIALSVDRPRTSARNVIRCKVSGLDRWGEKVRVQLAGAPAVVAEVTPSAVSELGLMPGSSLFASIKATEIEVYPA